MTPEELNNAECLELKRSAELKKQEKRKPQSKKKNPFQEMHSAGLAAAFGDSASS